MSFPLSQTRDKKIILAGELIDGSGGTIQRNIRLKIKNGNIDSIRKNDSKKNPHLEDQQEEIRDYSSSTIIPCLIDSHVHLVFSGSINTKSREFQFNANYDVIRKLISNHVKAYLSHGIMAVRDGGDKSGYLFKYREKTSKYKTHLMKIKVSGWAFHKRGRYGALIGKAVREKKTLVQEAMDFKEPIDQIKIINSGLNSLNEFGRETPPQFSLNEMKQTVHFAKKIGLKTMVHANGRSPVEIAIDSGCDSIEHGYFMGCENLKKMTDHQIYWVPTLEPMKIYSENPNVSQSQVEISVKNYEHQIEQLMLARRYGALIALGTDAGSPGVHHGMGLIEEMKNLKHAGFSIEEIIQCATLNNSKLLGLDNMGTLDRGKPANFIIVKGDHSKLPESLTDIEDIFIKGVPLNSTSFRDG